MKNESYYSYNGEFLNFNHVIFAKPISDDKVKIYIVGSAGAGNDKKYDIQHREHVLIWPKAVWYKIIANVSHIVDYNEDNGEVAIS